MVFCCDFLPQHALEQSCAIHVHKLAMAPLFESMNIIIKWCLNSGVGGASMVFPGPALSIQSVFARLMELVFGTLPLFTNFGCLFIIVSLSKENTLSDHTKETMHFLKLTMALLFFSVGLSMLWNSHPQDVFGTICLPVATCNTCLPHCQQGHQYPPQKS